jgi:hypothetical protein
MDRKILGLAMALAYPKYAFVGEDDGVVAHSRTLVFRARSGEAVAPEVADLLKSHPKLDDWVDDLLEDPALIPPELQPRRRRSYQPLPGDTNVIGAPRYVCPSHDDDFTWYQISAADAVPACTLCGRQLARDYLSH